MLKISHITKSYGDFCAVNDVSFETQQGQILGLIDAMVKTLLSKILGTG